MCIYKLYRFSVCLQPHLMLMNDVPQNLKPSERSGDRTHSIWRKIFKLESGS